MNIEIDLPIFEFQQWIDSVLRTNDVKQAVVITANQRLARFMANTLQNLADENPSQALPLSMISIVSLQQFVSAKWLQAQNAALELSDNKLLSKYEDVYIWEQVIDNVTNNESQPSPIADLIADKQSFAASLYDAFTIETAWQIPINELIASSNIQTAFYLDARKDYLQLLNKRKWLSQCQAESYLTDYFNQQKLPHIKSCALYGFNELSPQQIALFKACSADVVELALPSYKSTIDVHELPDSTQELQLIASWCDEQLKNQPNGTIGVIIPNLHKQKALVERIFTQQFAPHIHLNPAFHHIPDVPFEISLGSPLSEEPLISDAIELFKLTYSKLHVEDARRILTSPFWGQGITHHRLKALSQLSKWDMHELTTAHFIELLNQNLNADTQNPKDKTETFQHEFDMNSTAQSENSGHCHSVLLDAMSLYRQHRHQTQSFNAWSEFFKQWLTKVGWPGKRVINSREYQASQMLLQVLDALAVDDQHTFVRASHNLTQFLSHLKTRLQQKVFQLQVPTKPIQIMGTLEAIGLEFDATWLADVSRDNFPAKPKPNPFLDYGVQRRYQTPKSTPDKEYIYAKQLLTTFAGSARNVVMSVGLINDDTEQQLTPLVTTFANQIHVPSSPAPRALDKALDALLCIDALEIFTTPAGTPVDVSENTVMIKRGVKALEDTGVKPLFAYCIHRLGARQPVRYQLGIAPYSKGNILHNMLADFFSKYATLSAIKKCVYENSQPEGSLLPNSQLHLWLLALAKKHTTTQLKNMRGLLPEPLIELEQQHYVDIIFEWLKVDVERPDYKVKEIEKSHSIHFDLANVNVQFNIKIDRIDQTANNELVVTDYKTGSININDTLKWPLYNVQLPVYTLFKTDAPISAVCFAQIKTHTKGYEGFGILSEPIQGISDAFIKKATHLSVDSWTSLLSFWQTQLEQSMTKLIRGDINDFEDASHTSPNPRLQYYSYLESITRAYEQQVLSDMLSTQQNLTTKSKIANEPS